MRAWVRECVLEYAYVRLRACLCVLCVRACERVSAYIRVCICACLSTYISCRNVDNYKSCHYKLLPIKRNVSMHGTLELKSPSKMNLL